MNQFHSAPLTYVSHVHLKVEDLERSLQFYQQIIGFQLLERAESKALLTADGRTPLLTIEQPQNVQPKQPRTTGLYHFALLLPKRSDLARVLKHFIQIGYPLQGASDHHVSEAIYLADPDGNGIEIYRDRPSPEWKWNGSEVAMVTEPLDAMDLLAEAGEETWKGLPPETLMGHIHLHVADLTKTEEFYTKALGFDVVSRYGGMALFISTGRYHHHIGLNTWSGVGAPAPSENSVGLKSYTLLFPNETDRGKAIEQLRRMGAWIREGKGVVLTKDPSENLIELDIETKN